MGNFRHEPSDNAFYLQIEEEHAYLWYSRKQGALSLDRVFVPPDHRGQGWAAKLTEKVLQYCQRNNLKAIPSCGYVRDQFRPNNPQYDDLFVERATPPGADFLDA